MRNVRMVSFLFDLYEFIWNVTYAHIACWSIWQYQMRKIQARPYMMWLLDQMVAEIDSYYYYHFRFAETKMKLFQNTKFTHSLNNIHNPYEKYNLIIICVRPIHIDLISHIKFWQQQNKNTSTNFVCLSTKWIRRGMISLMGPKLWKMFPEIC